MAALASPRAELAGPGAETRTPSVKTQKDYIIGNAGLLNAATKRAILNIIMLEVGATVTYVTRDGTPVPLDRAELEARLQADPATEVATYQVVVEAGDGTDIDLDRVAEVNPDALHAVYGMVRARRQALDHPSKTGAAD